MPNVPYLTLRRERTVAASGHCVPAVDQPDSGVAPVAIRYALFLLKLNDNVGPYATSTGSDPSAGSGGGGGDSGYTYSGPSNTQTASSGYYF